MRQESTQRSAHRRPGPSGYPRCGRPAGPVAKLAGQKPAVVGQRDRTAPGEPPSLGGSEGDENRLVLQRGKNVQAQGRCAALSRSVPWSAVLDLCISFDHHALCTKRREGLEDSVQK